MAHPTHLEAARSVVLVVDVQEKLMVKIPPAGQLVRNMAFLVDAAGLAGVKVAATEQYPKGLGPTVAELARRLPKRPEKLVFSCCAVPGLVEGFKQDGRTQAILVGI